jgi:hypothetical protein
VSKDICIPIRKTRPWICLTGLLLLAARAAAQEQPGMDKPSAQDLPPPTDPHLAVTHRADQVVEPPKPAVDESPVNNPLPEAGETSTFTYSRSSEFPGVYEIHPRNDEANSSLISDSFLRLIFNNPTLDDERRLYVAQGYPDMVIGHYDETMDSMFPDASSPQYNSAFDTRTITLGDGTTVRLEQDALASPYVRVTLHTTAGDEEFSAARSFVDMILANPTLSDQDRAQAFKNFNFRLPEEARAAFSTLSRQEFRELVSASSLLGRHEFVRMRNVFKKVGERIATTNQAAGSGTNAPVYFRPKRSAFKPQMGPLASHMTMPPATALAKAGKVPVAIGQPLHPETTHWNWKRIGLILIVAAAGCCVGVIASLVLRNRRQNPS